MLMAVKISGAVVDVNLWPSRAGGSADFLHQGKRLELCEIRDVVERRMIAASLFLSQKNTLDPNTTLYTVFFGIK